MSDYTIRPFHSGDRDGFLDLYEAVFGTRKSTEWFAWKYEDNPYVDEVPAVVAERGGRLVGARPLFPHELRHGDADVPVLQGCDTMVHPNHRRQGIFTRMTERTLDRYADEAPVLFFEFPNENALPGDLKVGMKVVADTPTYYRIQRLSSFADLGDIPFGVVVEWLSDMAIWAYHQVRCRIGPRAGRAFSVDHLEEIPVDILTDLYQEHIPSRFHTVRDQTFYRWRFEDPEFDYSTYVVRDGGEVVATAVVGVHTEIDIAIIADILPHTPAHLTPHTGYDALLKAVLDDVPGVGLIGVREGVISPKLLARHGFYRDVDFPLSRFTGPITLAVRPLGTGAWSIDGHDLLDIDNWLLSYCDKDSL